MEENRSRMAQINNILKEASKAYYQGAGEIMTNYEYDALYDELLKLEKETGIVLSDSVTQNVGFEVLSELKKVEHETPMLSLDKTKSEDALAEWTGDKESVLSWKLDGLTVVLTYENGILSQAVTRGNGYVGEDVTSNARQFVNLPLRIPYKGKLVVRGEAVIKYSDFRKFENEYKNPRNLCSGSVRQLDSKITRERRVSIFIFNMVSAGNDAPSGYVTEQFDWLESMGFAVVEHVTVTKDTLHETVRKFSEKIGNFDIPSDGLVMLLNDIEYGRSLGRTSKFPRNSIAFKWADETEPTILKYIEWSPSRTGLINPVAVFEPVEIEGSTVSRASVHNVSIAESLELGEGDEILVYKANMIIPQISENHTRSGFAGAPENCPVCGAKTEIRNENDAKTLYCTNPDCPAKKVKAYALLASRDALNIEGMSEATMEKFIAEGFIRDYCDIFRLEDHRQEIAQTDGFGEKSADNLINAAKKASVTTVSRFIYALGIPEVGVATAKLLSSSFGHDFERFRNAAAEELLNTDGIGEVTAAGIVNFFKSEKNSHSVDELLKYISFEKEEDNGTRQDLAGMTFVITGDVHIFGNRKELQDVIEKRGGKVASSVSAKTSYLINNDINSSSSKNNKAKSLKIPIISEEFFVKEFDIG